MRRDFTILILPFLAIASARLAFLHDYPEWDQSTYFLVGDAMLHGKQLYAQIWDMKPPAIFATYAIANWFTRSSFEWSGYLLSVFSAIGTMLAIYFAGAKLTRNVGLLAAVLFALVCVEPALEGPIANTESFINLFIAIGFAIWLWRGERTSGAIFSGTCFALATMFKQVAVAPVIAIAVVTILKHHADERRGRSISRALLLLLPIPILWCVLGGYFALTGRGEIFIRTNFVYPLFYAGQNDSPAPSLAWLFEIFPLLILAIFAIARWRERFVREIAALLIGMAIAVVLPNRAFAHYFQLTLVPLSLAGAIGANYLWQRKEFVLRILAPVSMLALVALQAHWYFLSPRERAAVQHPASFFLNIADTGHEIRSLLRADETVYSWCDEPQLYVLAGKRPVAAGLWKMHTLAGPVAKELAARTLADLDRSPPDLVVLWQPFPGSLDQPIYRWIVSRYDEIPGNTGRLPLSLLVRRGSNLHARAIDSHDK